MDRSKLTLTVKEGSSLNIGDDVEIFIYKGNGRQFSVVVFAPKDVKIVRGDLLKRREELSAANQKARV